MLVKNQIYETQITDYTAEGLGVAKIEGCAVFIPNAVAGERVRVRIEKLGKTWAAGKITEILEKAGLTLQPKENWNGKREDPHAFAHMTDEEKNVRIQQEPAFGRIVCRCEEITEGEILLALRQNPKALDMDGVKRRTRSGMGRCQGGFCGPYVMQLIAKEQNVPMEDVTKFGGNSRMVLGKAGEV